MKFLISILFLTTSLSIAFAESFSLEKELPYAYSKIGKEHQLKICPDETCNIFRAPIATQKALLEKFVVIHDCSGWGHNYPQFKKFCNSNKTEIQKMIRDIGNKKCPDKKTDSLAKCVLKGMANEGKIIIQSERSDEGKSCLTTYHIEDILEKRAMPKFPLKTSCQ